jgi:hypothetical protein
MVTQDTISSYYYYYLLLKYKKCLKIPKGQPEKYNRNKHTKNIKRTPPSCKFEICLNDKKTLEVCECYQRHT